MKKRDICTLKVPPHQHSCSHFVSSHQLFHIAAVICCQSRTQSRVMLVLYRYVFCVTNFVNLKFHNHKLHIGSIKLKHNISGLLSYFEKSSPWKITQLQPSLRTKQNRGQLKLLNMGKRTDWPCGLTTLCFHMSS